MQRFVHPYMFEFLRILLRISLKTVPGRFSQFQAHLQAQRIDITRNRRLQVFLGEFMKTCFYYLYEITYKLFDALTNARRSAKSWLGLPKCLCETCSSLKPRFLMFFFVKIRQNWKIRAPKKGKIGAAPRPPTGGFAPLGLPLACGRPANDLLAWRASFV